MLLSSEVFDGLNRLAKCSQVKNPLPIYLQFSRLWNNLLWRPSIITSVKISHNFLTPLLLGLCKINRLWSSFLQKLSTCYQPLISLDESSSKSFFDRSTPKLPLSSNWNQMSKKKDVAEIVGLIKFQSNLSQKTMFHQNFIFEKSYDGDSVHKYDWWLGETVQSKDVSFGRKDLKILTLYNIFPWNLRFPWMPDKELDFKRSVLTSNPKVTLKFMSIRLFLNV